MADEWVRVKDPDTKHEFTVHSSTYEADKSAYELLNKKDAVNPDGTPLPAKPHLTPKQAEELKKEERA